MYKSIRKNVAEVVELSLFTNFCKANNLELTEERFGKFKNIIKNYCDDEDYLALIKIAEDVIFHENI